jgi:hypothetical protein
MTRELITSMPRNPVRRIRATALLTAGLCLAGALPTASAAPSAPSRSSGSYSGAIVSSGASAGSVPAGSDAEDRVRSYWTEERMAEAVTADESSPAVSPARTTEPHDAAEATGDGPMVVTPGRGPDTTKPPAGADHPDRVDGKVFFVDGAGQPSSCSGTVVNSPSRNLITTAAHCVWSIEAHRFHTEIQFVPAYDHGSAPYGTFVASTARVLDEYRDSSDDPGANIESDIAFVALRPDDRQQEVVDAVGGDGLVTGGGPRTTDARVFGYPADIDGGESLRSCTTSAAPDLGRAGTPDIVHGCGFGPGASGGAWVQDYDPATDRGNVFSVTSRCDVAKGYSLGPRLGPAVRAMFDAASTLG